MASNYDSWFFQQLNLNCTKAVSDLSLQNFCSFYSQMALENSCEEVATLHAVSESCKRRFLVCDQSCTRTTFIFNPATVSSVRCLCTGSLKPIDTCGFRDELNKDVNSEAGHSSSNGFNQNQESKEVSDMHEDTEELDALIYSDDDYSDDDEETSSAHLPSKNAEYDILKNEIRESKEVFSSAIKIKRKRILDVKEEAGESVLDTASSVRLNERLDYEIDLESRCVKKRLKIRQTMSILQSIIPGGKGKDEMLVLDEAIRYLRLLKLKAMSLGVTY